MNYSTKQKMKQFLMVRLQLVVVLSCVGLALLGQVPESSGGWLACPPSGVSLSQAKGETKRRQGARPRNKWGCAGAWGRLGQGWRVPAGRSLMMGLLWLASGQPGSVWLIGLPGLIWSKAKVGPEMRSGSSGGGFVLTQMLPGPASNTTLPPPLPPPPCAPPG